MAALEGKTILITGAARGIGAAAAISCHRAGAKVILQAGAQSASADAAAKAVGQTGADFLFEDFAEPGAGFTVFARALERAGRIDGVINNAGLFLASPLAGDLSDWNAGWATTMAVNVQAAADICRAAIAHFRERDGAAVVNIASRAGHRGDGPDHAAYAASKGAMLAMTKTYARALAGENILFYAIAPGWVETRMAPQDIEARKLAIRDIPLGRVAAPEEVADMAVFLLSGACPSATGATFDINGASYVR